MYSAICATIPDAAFFLDSNGTVLALSAAATRLIDRPAKEVIGTDLRTCLTGRTPHDDPLSFLATITTDAHAEPQPVSLRILTPKGATSTCPGTIVRLPAQTVLAGNFFLLLQEPVPAAAIPHSLLDPHGVQTFLDALPTIIYRIDVEGNFVYLNKSISNLGYEPQELLGKHFSTIIFPEDVERVSRCHVLPRYANTITGPKKNPLLFDERRTGKRMTRNLEVRLIRKSLGNTVSRTMSGSVISFGELSCAGTFDAPVDHARKQFLGSLGIITDISERKRLEERLVAATKLESVGKLAGGIAHDFNNRLAVILGYSEILREMQLEHEQQQRYADKIISSIKTISDFNKQLLAFARRGKNLEQPVDLHTILLQVIALICHSTAKLIAVSTDFDGDNCITLGDPEQLEGLFLNLALNACEAMPSGGTLTIRTSHEVIEETEGNSDPEALMAGKYICISVTDTGQGMTPNTQSHIFEPFFSTRKKGPAAGMGLASAMGIVKSHFGKITVTSKPDQGSTFCVWLPLAECDPVQEDDEEQSCLQDHPALPDDLSIMLIDDEPAVLEMGKELVRSLGFSPIVFSVPADAIALLKSDSIHPDIYIIDMVMPHMDGIKTFHAIRHHDPDAQIILSSGFTKNTAVQNLLDQGAIAFLHKPFRKKELLDSLARARFVRSTHG